MSDFYKGLGAGLAKEPPVMSQLNRIELAQAVLCERLDNQSDTLKCFALLGDFLLDSIRSNQASMQIYVQLASDYRSGLRGKKKSKPEYGVKIPLNSQVIWAPIRKKKRKVKK